MGTPGQPALTRRPLRVALVNMPWARVDSPPGVISRARGVVTGQAAGPIVRDLDDLPVPDYAEYFAMLERHGREAVLGSGTPMLLYESARGCWWGEKHHCTFCGLNRWRARTAGT